jgi:hypothetical protein
MKKFFFIFILLITSNVVADGYDVFGVGLYDIKFDGSNTNEALDIRYERRFDNSILEIGPEKRIFNLKPFAGFEITSDSAKLFS